MNIRLPQELIEYIDSVRGEKSRQAYLVNMLNDEHVKYKTENVLKTALKGVHFKG